ncbi:MAG: hypothetical protein K1X95_03795 [Acidimicrobiia bacterium]|nr:hypothetical protein [Acidimicrobiia bacterium]
MPDIYSDSWYEAVRDTINARVATLPERDVPRGSWHAVVEIVGDGASPYVDAESVRRFLVRIDDGHCAWYREIDTANPDGVDLDYRFVGPATAFDEIAAGTRDPIDAALDGTVRVRGDMRFLMRQAALVKTLLEAYTHGVQTEWPQGQPPYNGSGGDA